MLRQIVNGSSSIKSFSIEKSIEWFKEEGLNFLPIVLGGLKKPPVGWKKWQTERITDPEIQKYFLDNKKYNVGVITGPISRLVVLDFDDLKTFLAFFPNKEKHKDLFTVKTGRGKHVYFRTPEDIKTFNAKDSEGRDIFTLKGTGGYVITEPSIHENGNRYTIDGCKEIPDAGAGFREICKRQCLKIGLSFDSTEAIDIISILKGVPRGGRDNAAFLLVTYLRRQGSSKKEALRILHTWNAGNTPPLEASVIEEKVRNTFEMKEPYATRFLTNPSTVHIKEDLTLEEVETAQAKIEDVWYRDEKGERKPNWEIVRERIMDEHIFKTIREGEELLSYDNGIYKRHGKTVIKESIEELTGDTTTLFRVKEIIGHIERLTYIERDTINADKRFLPLKNGLLNFETFEIDAFDPEKVYNFQIPVEYDASAGFEHYEKFFKEILHPGDIEQMQELFGYALYTQHPAHKLALWTGTGRNGKSTAAELLISMIGAENNAGVALTELDGLHRFSVAELKDRLINVHGEPETKIPLETPLLKLATGGDHMTGETKHIQGKDKFKNFALFIVFANHIPKIADNSVGFWERVLAIDFAKFYKGKTAIKDYANVLIAQDGLAGLLNWAIIGLKRLKANKWEFTETASTIKAKSDLLRKAQPIRAFLDEWTKFDNSTEISKNMLFDGFELYCEIHKIPLPEERAFSRQMKAIDKVTEHKIKGEEHRIWVWRGLKFNENVVVVKAFKGYTEISADEAVDLEEGEVRFEEVALYDHLLCPRSPRSPGFSTIFYGLRMKMLVMENEDILSLTMGTCEKSKDFEDTEDAPKRTPKDPPLPSVGQFDREAYEEDKKRYAKEVE